MTAGLRKALKMSGFSILRDGESDFSLRDRHEQRPIVLKTPGILSKSEWSYAWCIADVCMGAAETLAKCSRRKKGTKVMW